MQILFQISCTHIEYGTGYCTLFHDVQVSYQIPNATLYKISCILIHFTTDRCCTKYPVAQVIVPHTIICGYSTDIRCNIMEDIVPHSKIWHSAQDLAQKSIIYWHSTRSGIVSIVILSPCLLQSRLPLWSIWPALSALQSLSAMLNVP